MPDNFGRMTSDEAPQSLKDFCFPKQAQKEESIYKHTPGPWMVGSTDDPTYMGDMEPGGIYVQQAGGARAVICEMDNLTENRANNARLMAAAPSMHDALWAIANMQVQEETDKGEVLALCMSIARLELEKCSADGK